jgi:hypothetical protein
MEAIVIGVVTIGILTISVILIDVVTLLLQRVVLHYSLIITILFSHRYDDETGH